MAKRNKPTVAVAERASNNREMTRSDAAMIARRIVDDHPRVKAFRKGVEGRLMSAIAKVQRNRPKL